MAQQASMRLINRVRKVQETLEADNGKTATKLGQQLVEEFPNSMLAKVDLNRIHLEDKMGRSGSAKCFSFV